MHVFFPKVFSTTELMAAFKTSSLSVAFDMVAVAVVIVVVVVVVVVEVVVVMVVVVVVIVVVTVVVDVVVDVVSSNPKDLGILKS